MTGSPRPVTGPATMAASQEVNAMSALILRGPRRAALVAIAAIVTAASLTSFAESYRALLLWAQHHGVPGPWGAVWPLMVDSFIAVGELALFVALADRWPLRSRALAWAVIVAGLGISVGGNIGHVASHALASRGTAAVPPLAAAAALAVGLGILKRVAAAVPDPETGPEPAREPAPEPAPETAPQSADDPEPAAEPVPARVPALAPVLVPAMLAAAGSDAARVRYAVSATGELSPAKVAHMLAAAGYPIEREACRSAMRRIKSGKAEVIRLPIAG